MQCSPHLSNLIVCVSDWTFRTWCGLCMSLFFVSVLHVFDHVLPLGHRNESKSRNLLHCFLGSGGTWWLRSKGWPC